MGYFTRDVGVDDNQVTHLFQKERFLQDLIIVDLLSYWESLRAGRVAPMRSELDPRETTGVLENTFVLEYNNALDVRFRLAGIELCEMMRMELCGMPAPSLIELGHRGE
ncbi:MAG: PAS domain-containing protein [Amylibacter sp.]